MPLRVTLLLFWLPIGAACTTVGDDFTQLDETKLVVGQTTENEIVALQGRPMQWLVGSMTINPDRKVSAFDMAPVDGILSILRYQQIFHSMDNSQAHKSEEFWFFNHHLESWSFDDDLPGASTDFDLARAGSVSKGMSAGEVKARLGAPAGKSFYPMLLHPNEQIWHYGYSHLTTHREILHNFWVLFGSDLHVVDMKIESADQAR